jgi:inner membrane protein involved in colicin E2 resistance
VLAHEIKEQMKQQRSDEFEEFDKIMGGLLSVPYSELQKKLEEEKQTKAKKKKRATSSSPASRASSASKKRS